jgi:mRNA interferase MazF
VRRYVPERGDLVWISFSPHAGREQAGRRPGLVLSPSRYNGRSRLALACPITRRVKGYPFEVRIDGAGGISGAVPVDHLRSLDWQARKAEYAGKAPAPVLQEVFARLRPLLEP